MSIEMLDALKSFARVSAYHAGFLRAYHRSRNADTLTVFGFHRVLPPDSPQLAASMGEYTISTSTFEGALDFIRRFYNVVDMDRLLEAHRGASRLPPYAALITFDDGWADNEEYAAPILRRFAFPATLFLNGGAVEGTDSFWREDLYAAACILGPEEFAPTWRAATGEDPGSAQADSPGRHRLIARAEGLSVERRRDLMEALYRKAGPLSRSRMMTPDQVRAWSSAFDLGGHGYRHDWMTHMADLAADLQESRRVVRSLGRPERAEWPETMSFPHGRYDTAVTGQAVRSGFALLFTSDACLNRTRGGYLSTHVLGRVFVTTRWTTRRGRFSPMDTANLFFRAPVLELDGSGPGRSRPRQEFHSAGRPPEVADA